MALSIFIDALFTFIVSEQDPVLKYEFLEYSLCISVAMAGPGYRFKPLAYEVNSLSDHFQHDITWGIGLKVFEK